MTTTTIGPTRTRIYLTIVRHREAGHRPQSLREIAAETGYALSTVHDSVLALRDVGLLAPADRSSAGVNVPTLRVVAHTPQENP